jgi:hypothetical protein
MAEYVYPKTQGGYPWNMLQRVKIALGLDIYSGEMQIDGIWKTVLHFPRNLSRDEKTALDAIMASNPTRPPATANTRFFVGDLFEYLGRLKSATGIHLDLFVTEEVLNSGKFDRLELHANRVLSSAEKTSLRAAYANLLQEAP